MNWIIITLSALFLWAITNIVDKALIAKYFKKPVTYTFFAGLFLAVPLLAIPYFGLEFISWGQTVLALLAGIIYLYALIPFFYAIYDEEVSRVIPVWQIMPIFVLALSYLFIGETLKPIHLIAFALLVSGSALISVKKIKGLLKLNKAFYLTSLSSFLFAVHYVISKYVYLNQSYVNGFLWIRIGGVIALISLFFIPNFRKNIVSTFKALPTKIFGIIIASDLCGMIGTILLNYAISLNSVSLISAMEGIQSVFVLLMALAISKWKPGILKEEMGRKTIAMKITAIIIIILGLVLVNI